MQDDHFSYKNCYQRKKNKTRSHFNLNTMKAILYIYIYIYIYIWDNSALMFSKQLLTSKSD